MPSNEFPHIHYSFPFILSFQRLKKNKYIHIHRHACTYLPLFYKKQNILYLLFCMLFSSINNSIYVFKGKCCITWYIFTTVVSSLWILAFNPIKFPSLSLFYGFWPDTYFSNVRIKTSTFSLFAFVW